MKLTSEVYADEPVHIITKKSHRQTMINLRKICPTEPVSVMTEGITYQRGALASEQY